MAVVLTKTANRLRAGFFEYSASNTAANDVAVTSTSGLFRPGITGLGLRFAGQGPTGWSIDVYFTHDVEQLALTQTPAAQAGVSWLPVTTLNAANPMIADPSSMSAVAIKAVFRSAGSRLSVSIV
mgnify:CR=1 FL=1